MRVTKLIRQYVEESVRNVYNPKIQQIKDSNEARQNTANSEIEKIIDKANEEIKAWLAGNPEYQISTRWGMEERYIDTNRVFLKNQQKDEISKLYDECNKKIQNILIELELGATRAELDKMLANI